MESITRQIEKDLRKSGTSTSDIKYYKLNQSDRSF